MTGTLSRVWDVFFVALLLFVAAVFVGAATVGPIVGFNAWMLGVFAYSPLPWTPGMPTGIRRFIVWSASVAAGFVVLLLVRAVGLGGLVAWFAAATTAPVVAKKLASMVVASQG